MGPKKTQFSAKQKIQLNMMIVSQNITSEPIIITTFTHSKIK